LNGDRDAVVERHRQMDPSVRILRAEPRGGGGMGRSSWIVGFLVLLSLFAISGCYTVLRHPTGESVTYDDTYHYKTCADCHADASFYHPYYTYGRSHYRWRDYYGYPWWYDDYWWWYPYDYGYDEEGPEVKRGAGHLWGSGGWPSGGWGFRSPQSEGDGGAPSETPPARRPLRIRPTERSKAKAEPPKPPEKNTPKEPEKEPQKQPEKKDEKKPDAPLEPKPDRPAPRPARPTPKSGR
jgi:hypothetical protein